MSRRTGLVELAVVAPAERASARAAERTEPERQSGPAPRRMSKRCRHCGEPVPTLGGLAWRARRLLTGLEAAAAHVFHARVEASEPGTREASLGSAHARHEEGRADARKLVADLVELQAHDGRCRPSLPPDYAVRFGRG